MGPGLPPSMVVSGHLNLSHGNSELQARVGSSEPGSNCITFYDPASKVTGHFQSHFCQIQQVEAATRLPRLKGRGRRPQLQTGRVKVMFLNHYSYEPRLQKIRDLGPNLDPAALLAGPSWASLIPQSPHVPSCNMLPITAPSL